MSDRPTRHIRPVVAAVVAVATVAVAVAVVVVVVLFVDSDDEPDVVDAGRAVPADGDGVELGEECEAVHAGHNLMMWNAVMADEMLDAGCGWPYPPFDVPFTLGPDDVEPVDAPFEPRRYDDLWRMLAALDVGVCQIQTLPDPPGEGFAFGFTYDVGEPGCPEQEDAVEMTVREYVSAPARDRAVRLASEPLVLGRWLITLEGGSDPRRQMLASALEQIGALAP